MGGANLRRDCPDAFHNAASDSNADSFLLRAQKQEVAEQIRALHCQGKIKLFYKRKEWRRKRAQILERDNHECQKCKARGKQSQATCVHHILHLDQRPDLALVDSNLVSLCDECHNEEHPEKLRRYTVSKKGHITPERW